MNDAEKIDSGFGELRDRVGRLEQGLQENTEATKRTDEATKRIEEGVGELIELMKYAKGGVKFLTLIGRGLRQLIVWFGPFITIGAAIWALAHGRWPPDIK